VTQKLLLYIQASSSPFASATVPLIFRQYASTSVFGANGGFRLVLGRLPLGLVGSVMRHTTCSGPWWVMGRSSPAALERVSEHRRVAVRAVALAWALRWRSVGVVGRRDGVAKWTSGDLS
jgi:hypothetical protein